MSRAGESLFIRPIRWLTTECPQAVSDHGLPLLTDQQVFRRKALCELHAGAE